MQRLTYLQVVGWPRQRRERVPLGQPQNSYRSATRINTVRRRQTTV